MLERHGMPDQHENSPAWHALPADQVLSYLFNCRYLHSSSLGWRAIVGNRIALVSIAVVLGLQVAFTYLGFMQSLFGTAALGLTDWAVAGALALALFAMVEAEKWITRKRGMS